MLLQKPSQNACNGKDYKEGIWLSYELSENAILNRLSIAVSLLARQRKKSFL